MSLSFRVVRRIVPYMSLGHSTSHRLQNVYATWMVPSLCGSSRRDYFHPYIWPLPRYQSSKAWPLQSCSRLVWVQQSVDLLLLGSKAEFCYWVRSEWVPPKRWIWSESAQWGAERAKSGSASWLEWSGIHGHCEVEPFGRWPRRL